MTVSYATGPSCSYVFPFLFHVTFYDICMSHGEPPRLFSCHAYVFSLMPVTHPVRLLRLVSSPGLRYAHIDDLSLTRAGSSYAQSSTRLLTLTRLDVVLVSHSYGFYACLYLYLPYLYIYWVGDGTIPIFNLLCNHPSVLTCEIPRTLLVSL